MTTSPVSPLTPPRRLKAFTLVEIMIGASIGSIVLIGVMATYMMLLRSGVSASAYAEMESQARRTFEQLGIDARMASDLSSSGTTSITLTVPNNYSSTSNKVTYGYDSTNQLFYLVPGDGITAGQTYVAPGTGTAPTGQQVLMGKIGNSLLNLKVTRVTFNRYDSSSASTSLDSAAKHIQVSINVQRAAARVVTIDETILSSAFTMRNKI
jgi:Tfp pilus assembly protein PilW